MFLKLLWFLLIVLGALIAPRSAHAEREPVFHRFTFPVPRSELPCDLCGPPAPATRFAFYLIYPSSRTGFIEQLREFNPYQRDFTLALKHWDEQVALTKKLVEIARREIFFGFEKRGPLSPAFRAGLDRRLQRVEKGEAALVLVTEENNPLKVYLTVGIGFDFGEGLPSEQDLVRLGQPPLPREELREGSASIRLLRMMGSAKDVTDLEAWVARQRYIFGGRNELGLFVRPHASEYDFAPFLQRVLIANQLTLFTRIPVGRRHAAAPSPCDGCEEILAREPHYNFYLPRELRSPQNQRYSIATEIVVWAMGSELERLYVRQFNFGNPVETIRLPGFPDDIHRFSIPREKWEGEIYDLLNKRKGGEIGRNTSISWSIISKETDAIIDCVKVLTAAGN